MDTQLYNDRQVAAFLGVSTSWVRLQRFNRRHGKPHVFNLDPVLVGSSPRYVRRDVDEFVVGLIRNRERRGAPDGGRVSSPN
ncbi:hypothetical protein [Phenylobacterium sp.]|uniref:hypothetical protein n=1 Tax=Phenylobacterium sp. TaxID=1871053 RepID=UPI002DF20B29|nr:hypothetical protein [Phenylobacterium sp.]